MHRTTLPKMVVEDPIGRAWAALYDVAAEGFRWDHRDVKASLAAAIAADGEALRWPARFLARHPAHLRVVQVWVECQKTGCGLERALSRRGIKGSTGRYRCWQAMVLIASGLMEAGEPLPLVEGGDGGASSAPALPLPPPVDDDAALAPSALWETVSAALAQRRPYDCPRQLVNKLLVAQVREEFAGLDLSKRVLRDMDTRGRQLRVLARRRGLLVDAGAAARSA